MGAGVPSGLQNQREGLGASWVGSIPTYSRHSIIKACSNLQAFLLPKKSLYYPNDPQALYLLITLKMNKTLLYYHFIITCYYHFFGYNSIYIGYNNI